MTTTTQSEHDQARILQTAHAARRFLHMQNAVILDVEATGLHIEDQAVEIAVLDTTGKKVLNSLINPGYPVSPSAAKVHGLSQNDIDGAPATQTLEPRIRKALTGKVIAGYNVPFAIATLQHTLREAGFTNIDHGPGGPLCIMRLFAKRQGHWLNSKRGYRWFTLESALDTAGLKHPKGSGALAHARAGLTLLKYLSA